MDNALQTLSQKALELGATEVRLMDVNQIVYDSRSVLKCRFGCHRWGKFWTCPPNLGLTPDDFRQAFQEYKKALIIKTPEPGLGQDVALAIEKEAMLNFGMNFAFALVLCVKCEKCAYPNPCNFPNLARPSIDACGIDVMKTVTSLGFESKLDPMGQLLPSWFTMVLLD